MKYLTPHQPLDDPDAKNVNFAFSFGRVLSTSIILLVILLCSMQCAYAQESQSSDKEQLATISSQKGRKKTKKKIRFHGVPKDITTPCDAPLPEWPAVQAEDHKGRSLVVIPTLEQTNSGLKVERRWTAISKNGDRRTAVQEIHLEDTEAPTLSVPEDLLVGYQEGIPSPTYVSTDNCTETTVHLKETISVQDGTYNLLRTWTAKDLANNVTTSSQNITIVVREMTLKEMD